LPVEQCVFKLSLVLFLSEYSVAYYHSVAYYM